MSNLGTFYNLPFPPNGDQDVVTYLKNLYQSLVNWGMDLAQAFQSIPGFGFEFTVNKEAHGYSTTNVVRSDGAGSYVLAQADSEEDAEAIGVISEVMDVNHFKVMTLGLVSSSSVPNEAPGTVLYLDPDTAGSLTTTEPTDLGDVVKPIAIVTKAEEEMLVFHYRGNLIGFIEELFNIDGGHPDSVYANDLAIDGGGI